VTRMEPTADARAMNTLLPNSGAMSPNMPAQRQIANGCLLR